MREHAAVLILVVVIGGGIFINARRTPFLLDDRYIIVHNEQIRDLRRAAASFGLQYWLRQRARGEPMGFRDYRPVTELSFALDYAIWQLNPLGYHVTSILTHVANCVLVYFLALRILGTRHAAAFSSLLFAAHPIHVEPIVWAKARAALLALLFVLAAILLYVRYLERPRAAAALYAGSLTCFALALCSQASGLVLPVLLALYLWCFPVPGRRRAFLALVPFVGLVALFFALNETLPDDPTNFLPMTSQMHLLTIVATPGPYLRLLVLPINLCLSHHFSIPMSADAPVVLRALPWELALIFALVLTFRRSKTAFFALAWMPIAMVPVSNIVPLGRPIAEPRAYLPSVGFCLLVALVLHAVPALARTRGGRRTLHRLSLALCASLVALYSGLTVARNLDWTDAGRLHRDTLAKNPRSVGAHIELASVYVGRGQPRLALPHLRQACALAPIDIDARNQLATLCRHLGLYDEAITQYVWLLEYRPGHVETHIGLGIAYAEKGSLGRAAAQFEEALRLDPGNYHARLNLGLAHLRSGNSERAAAELRQAVEQRPDSAFARHHLGVAYHRMGRRDLALRQYEESVRLEPGRAETWLAMGMCYQEEGNEAEAIRCYEECLEVGGPLSPEVERRLAQLRATQSRVP
jgi:tetratricopeptide (TPR) repeat protein